MLSSIRASCSHHALQLSGKKEVLKIQIWQERAQLPSDSPQRQRDGLYAGIAYWLGHPFRWSSLFQRVQGVGACNALFSKAGTLGDTAIYTGWCFQSTHIVQVTEGLRGELPYRALPEPQRRATKLPCLQDLCGGEGSQLRWHRRNCKSSVSRDTLVSRFTLLPLSELVNSIKRVSARTSKQRKPSFFTEQTISVGKDLQ